MLKNLELNHNPYWYGVTITPKGNKVSMEQLIDRISHMVNLKNIITMYLISETSTQGVNHMHGIMELTKLNKFTKAPNLVILTKKLYNIHGWIKYCNKDHPTELYGIQDNIFHKYKIVNGSIQYCPQQRVINPYLSKFINKII